MIVPRDFPGQDPALGILTIFRKRLGGQGLLNVGFRNRKTEVLGSDFKMRDWIDSRTPPSSGATRFLSCVSGLPTRFG